MELVLDLKKRYTFADYLTWIDDVRRELIDGFIKMMSAPTFVHADVVVEITWYLKSFVKKKKGRCKVICSPVAVRFYTGGVEDADITTVVQPDVCVVCDLSKIDRKKGILGAPDMIVEVISPSTGKRDLNEKFNLYEKHGVIEYWVVYPEDKTIHAFVLCDGKYGEGTIYTNGIIPVSIFPECQLDIEEIFDLEY